jgi:hypothetical protein
VYVGTTSGVFRSSDGGATWAPANTGLTSTAITALDVFPPSVGAGGGAELLVGTAAAPALFRSTDRAANWQPAISGPNPLTAVNAIAKPTPGQIVVATPAGPFQCADDGSGCTAKNEGLTVSDRGFVSLDAYVAAALAAPIFLFGASVGMFVRQDAIPLTPTPTATATSTATATPTGTATATATASPTSTGTAIPTTTGTPTRTATSTATPTGTATATRTATGTPTATGTATRTATQVPASCAPRPPVGIAAVPNGDGRLRVTVSATTNPGTPTNQLSSLHFAAGTNAEVYAELFAQSVPFTVNYPPETMQATFYVARLTAGQTSTVSVEVLDRCGSWPTFVGGGPSAF